MEILDFEFSEEFTKLEELYFDRNKISDFSVNFVEKVANLRIFSAAFNRIEKISEDFFSGNLHLEEVNFEHNLLKIIPPEIFKINWKIKILRFNGNLCIDQKYFAANLGDFFTQIQNHCNSSKSIFKLNNTSVIMNNNNNSSSNDCKDIENSNLDILVTSLFWMIIPIIIILFAILALILYAIYNKFVVYLLANGSSRN